MLVSNGTEYQFTISFLELLLCLFPETLIQIRVNWISYSKSAAKKQYKQK